MRVACLGSGSGKAGNAAYDAMLEVGRLLALRHATVVTGAYGGVGMKAAPEGAHNQDRLSRSVGYTHRLGGTNEYIFSQVDCLTIAKTIIATITPRDAFCEPLLAYAIRLAGLLSSDAFIIASGGGVGTLLELVAILSASAKGLWSAQKRVAVLHSSGSAAWPPEILDQLSSWAGLGAADTAYIRAVNFPRDAVEWVLQEAHGK